VCIIAPPAFCVITNFASHSALPAEAPQDIEMGSVDGPRTDADQAQASPIGSDIDAMGEDDDSIANLPAAPSITLLPTLGQSPPSAGQIAGPSNGPFASDLITAHANVLSTAPAAPTATSTLAAAPATPAPAVSLTPFTSLPGAAAGFGPPRRFVVPAPSAPTIRGGPRSGTHLTREQVRGFTLAPE
jgi:hypothetical protein